MKDTRPILIDDYCWKQLSLNEAVALIEYDILDVYAVYADGPDAIVESSGQAEQLWECGVSLCLEVGHRNHANPANRLADDPDFIEELGYWYNSDAFARAPTQNLRQSFPLSEWATCPDSRPTDQIGRGLIAGTR